MEALGKRVALVLWGENDAGEDQAWAMAGLLSRRQDGSYYLSRGSKRPVEVKESWLADLTPVAEKYRRSVLGAEFQISLPIELVKGAERGRKSR